MAAWVIEAFFDTHRAEVTTQVDAMIAHRPKWYRDKTLGFMVDKTLIEDTDRYDVSGMTEDDIAAAMVVKHAVAVESIDASMLTIKVAGETDGERTPLNEQIEEQLSAYLVEIKDAGVRINLVNMAADIFNCNIDIYYDAILQPSIVQAVCREAIISYIENLPFNGEFTNMSLVDVLQAVEGVKVVHLNDTSVGENSQEEINARYVPEAGYFKAGNITINMLVYGQLV